MATKLNNKELKRSLVDLHEKLNTTLLEYVNESCAQILSDFVVSLFELVVEIFPVSAQTEDVLTLRTLTTKIDAKLKGRVKIPNPVKNCLSSLEESSLKELSSSIAVVLLSREGTKLSRWSESKILLDIFHKACEKDLKKMVEAWKKYLPNNFEELIFKLFDAFRLLAKISEFEDFENIAMTLLQSFHILSEAYYRKLLSFLLDCIDILEGKSLKKEIRYIGKSYYEFEKYKTKYPDVEIFFDKVIKVVRNSVAHTDYEIDVINKVIIVKNGNKEINRLSKEDIESKINYLVYIGNIFIHFYFYVTCYLIKRKELTDLVWKEVEQMFCE